MSRETYLVMKVILSYQYDTGQQRLQNPLVQTSMRGHVCLDMTCFEHAIIRSKVCVKLAAASALSSIEFKTSSVANRIPICRC